MNSLTGKNVLVTRAPHQTTDFVRLLQEHGAIPLLYPCIEIHPPQNTGLLDQALRQLVNGEFHWLVITSVNSAYILAKRLQALHLTLNSSEGIKVAAVGPATAQAVSQYLNLDVSMIPDQHTAAALATQLELKPGTRVLLPQSEIADQSLVNALTEMQTNLVTVTAYQNRIATGGIQLMDYLQRHALQAITFTSSSTVTNFIERFQVDGGEPEQLSGVCIACIGPKTAEAARKHDLQVDVIPQMHTIPALVSALQEYFIRQESALYGHK